MKQDNRYIRLSDSSFVSTTVSILLMLFPVALVIAYWLNTDKTITEITVCSFVILLLLFLNVYINIFVYTVLYDRVNDNFMIRRFGSTVHVSTSATFDIRSYGVYGVIYAQYGFVTDGWQYRFRTKAIDLSRLGMIKGITAKVKDTLLRRIDL